MEKRALTKEEIKAIRIVRGFTPDLRIKLNNVDKESLWKFIDENVFGLLGAEVGTDRPAWNDPEFDEWEKYINRLVSQVVEGWH